MSKPKKIRGRFGGALEVGGTNVGDLTVLTIDTKTLLGRTCVNLTGKAAIQLRDAIDDVLRRRGMR